MSNPDWYFITRFEEFIDHSRGLIFDLFLGSNKENPSDEEVIVSYSSSNDDIGKILSCFEEDEPGKRKRTSAAIGLLTSGA